MNKLRSREIDIDFLSSVNERNRQAWAACLLMFIPVHLPLDPAVLEL